VKTRQATFDVRPYEDKDETEVLQLLRSSLGGGPAGVRPASFFRWKHLENPFGRSFMLVAESGGSIIGLRAFLRWTFEADGETFRAVRAVDTATHPAYQGLGIFSKLTTQAIDMLGGDADFVFNTPNDKSLPGYLKMGWLVVARVPIHIRVANPATFALRAIGSIPGRAIEPDAEPATAVLERYEGVARDLLASSDRRLGTALSLDYLKWRYGDAPLLDYRAIGSAEGIAFFRVRPRGRLVEATVSDVLVRDASGAAKLLRAIRRAAHADHLATHFASATPARGALRRTGFVRVPRGPVLVARPLHDGVRPDPVQFQSWRLSLGDLEVF